MPAAPHADSSFSQPLRAVQDMVHLRRKNLVHGEDHHKYLYQSAVEGSPEGATSPPRGSHEHTMNGAVTLLPCCERRDHHSGDMGSLLARCGPHLHVQHPVAVGACACAAPESTVTTGLACMQE